MIDPLAKMRSLILAQSTLATLVSNRVSCERFPEDFAGGVNDDFPLNAPKAISLSIEPSELGKQAPLGTFNFVFYCWGESQANAMTVACAVVDALHMKQRLTADGTTWIATTVEGFGPADVAMITESVGWEFVEVRVRGQVAYR